MSAAPHLRSEPAPGGAGEFRPPVPAGLLDTGLGSEALTDLLLKVLHIQGAKTIPQLVETVRLPFRLIDDRLMELQQRRYMEVRGTTGHGRGGYVFDLAGGGRDRARHAIESNQYAGPAPVPLAQYRDAVERQSIAQAQVTRDRMREGLKRLVLGDAMIDMLGPAVNSGRSLFLYGAPGNGKTLISETIAAMLGGPIYLPYAIEVEGQILNLFDPLYHHPIPTDPPEELPEEVDERGPRLLRPDDTHDQRYVRVTRPVVMAGGELTLDQLELRHDPTTNLYQAPFQLKSNGGVLILDDFGRQRASPRDLLNRWIVPLEKRIDFLTLHTGGKFPVPFDTLLIFATNLSPSELVDEAFLRRIHYKIHVEGPDRDGFREIFRRCCLERGIPYEERAVEHIYARYYEGLGMRPRACHSRDVLDHLLDIARFVGAKPQLSPELLERACQSYFLDEQEPAQ